MWCPPRQQRRVEGTLLPFNGRQNLWLSCCTGLFMGTLCNKSLPVTLGRAKWKRPLLAHTHTLPTFLKHKGGRAWRPDFPGAAREAP